MVGVEFQEWQFFPQNNSTFCKVAKRHKYYDELKPGKTVNLTGQCTLCLNCQNQCFSFLILSSRGKGTEFEDFFCL